MHCPAPHSFLSGDKEVDVLWRPEHLCRPLDTNHSGQPLGVVLGIEHSTGPRGLLSSTGGSQHITDFTVEVRICWQFVEYQVPDAFYCVPVREGVGMKKPASGAVLPMASETWLTVLLDAWGENRSTNHGQKATRARGFIFVTT